MCLRASCRECSRTGGARERQVAGGQSQGGRGGCIAPLDRHRVGDDGVRVDDRPRERGCAADVDRGLAEGQPGDRGRLLKDRQRGRGRSAQAADVERGRGRKRADRRRLRRRGRVGGIGYGRAQRGRGAPPGSGEAYSCEAENAELPAGSCRVVGFSRRPS